jgi:hypothetical protein
MNILAIDIGTTTGWARSSRDGTDRQRQRELRAAAAWKRPASAG